MKKHKIFFDGKEHDASDFQNVIFDNIEHGCGNMVINASAGASKTTTIVNSIKLMGDKKVLFIAFNTDIVGKIRSMVGKENAKITTFHSLGYYILKENIETINKLKNINDKDYLSDFTLNEFKYKNHIKNNIDNITRYNETASLGRNRMFYINNIINLCDYCRYYLEFSIIGIKEIADKYSIIPIRDEYEVVKKVLKWGKENIDTIDYTDMIWLPNVLNLTTTWYTYDWILIDEAQDTSITQQKLIEKCKKRGCRMVSVLDPYQNINVWCGASTDAIEYFRREGNTKEFKLPISYRCAKSIVRLANKFNEDIIPCDNAEEGEIRYDVNTYSPQNGDMVLCRNTAPLIDLHLKYLRINKASFIRGQENIRNRFYTLISNKNSKYVDKEITSKDGLFPLLYKQLFSLIETAKETLKIDENDALLNNSVLTLYDDIQSLQVLSEGITTVNELKDKIDIIFGVTEKNAIQLSTVHKAKGLEANNVFILYPSLMPSKLATAEWEIQTEKNLQYVAYTRAKKTLSFIKEDKLNYNLMGSFDMNAMKINLKKIKDKIGYNIEKDITETDRFKPSNTINILGETAVTSTSKITRKKGGLKFKKLM